MAFIFYVVGIGKTQTMRKFMANGADTIHGSVGLYLVSAGVCVYGHTVEFQSCFVFRGTQCPLVRPYGSRTSTICFAHTGINHQYLIHVAIGIPIVLRKIYTILYRPTGLCHHRSWPQIVAQSVIPAIIRCRIIQVYRTNHIERKFKLSSALCLKVIGYATSKAIGRDKILGICYSVVKVLIMLWVEHSVVKLHQDDKSFLLTCVDRWRFCAGKSPTYGFSSRRKATTSC